MPSPDRASPHASLAPSPPQFTKTAPAHLTSNSHPSPAPQSSHSSHAHTAATPRAAFLTTPPSPTHQVPTVTTPTVPRLDVRKLATLSQIRLPDSVLTLTARSHGATNPTLISKLSYARPQTDRPAIRSPATHRQIISPPTPTPVPLTTNTAPPPLSSATSPALLAYQTQKRLSKKTRQPNAIDTFGYRPSSLEDSDLMDQRIKNNKRAMEAAEAASKEANGSDDEDAADDMTGRLSPMSLKQAELSAVFKIEGHVVRTLIMSLNPRNIRWLRNEFEEGSDPANHDCITGPQFIKCMSKVFNEPDIMLDEDKGLDSSMRTTRKKITGYGLSDANVPTPSPRKHLSFRNRSGAPPEQSFEEQTRRTSILPGGYTPTELQGGLTPFDKPSQGGKRMSIIPGCGIMEQTEPISYNSGKRTSIILGGGVMHDAPPTPAGRHPHVEREFDAQADLMQRQAANAQKASTIFRSVDLRDTGLVSWKDFTDYVVSSFQYTEMERVETIAAYQPTQRINTSYNKEMERIFKIDDIGPNGSLVITEKGTKSFKIVTPDNFKDLHTLRPSKWKEIKGHQGDILAVDHMPEFGYLVTSSTDCTINFWDTNHFKLCQRMPVRTPQLTTEWFPTTATSRRSNQDSRSAQPTGILFTAGLKDPKTNQVTITGYNPATFQIMSQMNEHTDTILDLHSIPALHTLVSCGMDSKICLWDLHTQQYKKTLIGHTKGVLDIDYSHDHRLLASAGFDHDVMVWNPHVENMICRLSGHTAALIGVKMSERSPEILSASRDGVIKIWDIRTFKCAQTIYCETKDDLTDFSYFEGETHGCMIVGSRRTLHLFENEPEEDPKITDVELTVDVVFQAATCSFISAALNTVKVWDSRNGTLIKRYNDLELTPNPKEKDEITSLSLDWTDRRLLIGTLSGHVSMWLVSSFAKLYQMDGHRAEVSNVTTISSLQLIISSSWDNTIKIQILEDNTTPLTIATLSHVVAFRRFMDLANASGEDDEGGVSKTIDDFGNAPVGPPSPRYKRLSSGGPPGAAAAKGRRGSIMDIFKNDMTGARGGGRRGSAMGMNQLQMYAAQRSTVSNVNSGRRQTMSGGMLRKAMDVGLTFVKEQENWEVKRMSVSAHLGMIATASTNPVILLWDIYSPKSTRALGCCIGHQFEISNVEFMSSYPILISSDMGGEIIFWTLLPNPKPHRKLYGFVNPGRKILGSTAAVTGFGWLPENELLVTSDAEGRLKLWDVMPALTARGAKKLTRARLGSSQVDPSHIHGLRRSSTGKISGFEEGDEQSWDSNSSSESATSDSESSSFVSLSCDDYSDDESEEEVEFQSSPVGMRHRTLTEEENGAPLMLPVTSKPKAKSTFLTGTKEEEDEGGEEAEKEEAKKEAEKEEAKKEKKEKRKPEADLVRHWEAHSEGIEHVKVVTSNFLKVWQFGHKHGHKHQHQHHHHHHHSRRNNEFPPHVNEADVDREYTHNPQVLMASISFDLEVKLWALDGSCVGTLQQGALVGSVFGKEESDRRWRVDVNDDARGQKHDQDALGSLSNSMYRRKSRLNSFMSTARRNSDGKEEMMDVLQGGIF